MSRWIQDINKNRIEQFENYIRVWRYYPDGRKIAFYMVKDKWVKCSCGYPAPYEINDSGEIYCPACQGTIPTSTITGGTNE